jgi:hypothetical protein
MTPSGADRAAIPVVGDPVKTPYPAARSDMSRGPIRTVTAISLISGLLWAAAPASAAVTDRCVGGTGADTIQACEN